MRFVNVVGAVWEWIGERNRRRLFPTVGPAGEASWFASLVAARGEPADRQGHPMPGVTSFRTLARIGLR